MRRLRIPRIPAPETDLSRYNFFYYVLEGSLFWAAMSFLDGNTVVAVFLDGATGNAMFAGLAASLRAVMASIGQLVMGMFIHKLPSQVKFMGKLGFYTRPIMALMFPILLLNVNGMFSAWAFIVLYSLFFFSDGFVALIWNESLARTIPLRQRGRINSFQQLIGGIVGLGTSQLVGLILDAKLASSIQFAIIFGCAGGILAINSLALHRIHDLPIDPATLQPVPKLGAYLKSFIPLVKQSKVFRKVAVTRVLFLCSLLAAPINILFGRSQGGLTDEHVSILLTLQIIGQILAGVYWAYVCSHKNYRTVILQSQYLVVALNALSILCLFLADAGVFMLVPLGIVMFLTTFTGIAWIGYNNYLIANVSDEHRAMYYILLGLVLIPFNFGMTGVGMISSMFGFAPVYIFTFLCSVAGLIITLLSFYGKRAEGEAA